MSAASFLIVASVAYLALFAAVGSAPALVLACELPSRLVLAPILGFAIAACGLTTLALVMPMRTAAWVVLLPGALVSLGFSLNRRLRPSLGDLREAAVPGLLAVLAVLLAILPAALHGTRGPLALAVYDGWGYIQTDAWLQGHRVGDELPVDAPADDMSLTYGHSAAGGDQRIGVSAVNAAASSLLGVPPDESHLPFLAALFALVPLAIWVAARGLGVGRLPAALGACFGLSPAVLSLVADSTLGNLAAVVLVAPALFFLSGVLFGGSWRDAALTAVFVGGLLAVFPEFMPPLVVAGGGGAVLAVLAVRGRSGRQQALLEIGRRSAFLAVGALAVAPVAAERAFGYVRQIMGAGPAVYDSLPARGLSLENGGAWAFGVLHVYQLPRFELLSEPKQAVAMGLPVALAALVAVGAWWAWPRSTVLLLLPAGAAIALGLYAYGEYQRGHCEYCLWKSLTFLLPCLGLGVAYGVQQLLAWLRPGAGFLLLAAGGFLAVVTLSYSNTELTRARYESPAIVHEDLRRVAHAADSLPASANVLVEGLNSTAALGFNVPASYFLLRRDADADVSLDTEGGGVQYLGPQLPPPEYYSSRYTHVLSSFPGIRSDRKPIAAAGGYALYERADVDVAVMRAGYAVDPSEEERAVPWLTGHFDLWVSSSLARRRSLILDLAPAPANGGRVLLDRAGTPLAALKDGSRMCVDLVLPTGLTILSGVSEFASPPPLGGRATETDPVPPPPKALGLRGIRAEERDCASLLPGGLPEVRFGAGWHGKEYGPGGQSARWMSTSATTVIGSAGGFRPAVRITTVATSFAVPRRLTIRLEGRLILSLSVPPSPHSRPVSFRVPAGRGPAAVTFVAAPGAQSATLVNPADERMIAVYVPEPRVERLPETTR